MLSVLNQDYASLEYLVIDGGSEDASVRIIERYADRLAYWESAPDRGQTHAINKGLRLARGEILGWLNSDDLLLPGVISRIVEVFERNPKIDVVYGHVERIDADGRMVPTPRLPKDLLTFGKDLVIGECVINQPGSFWRRRAMDAVGLLNETLVYNMDYEYWIRLALSGSNFMRLPDTVAHFRLSSTSKTVSRAEKMAEERLEILEKILKLPDLPAQLGLSPNTIARQARKARARISLHAFYGYLKNGERSTAWSWFKKVLRQDPWVLIELRWFKLAIAGIRRRLGRKLRPG